MQHDTHELLSAFRAGDREAYAALVVRFEGLVRTACRRQAPSADVDDCVQAVFIVLERRPAAAARAPVLEAWLLRVCCLVCRRAQRAARRRLRAERTVAAQALGVTDSTEPEALSHLDECLDALPERQRLAVVMCYLSGSSAAEIAERLQITHANARQLVSRGLGRLRILFARRGITASIAGLEAIFELQTQAADASLTGTAISPLLTSPPSSTATHLSHGVIHSMILKSLAPIAAAVVLPGFLVTAYLAAEAPPPSPVHAGGPAGELVADTAGIRVSKASWDGNDLIASVSYAVPAGVSAEIHWGIKDPHTGQIIGVPAQVRPAPVGHGALSCRITGMDHVRRIERDKPITLSAMLMPVVHEARWSPLAQDQARVDPAWTAQRIALASAGRSLADVVQELAQQSGATIQLDDPDHRAKNIAVTVAAKEISLADAIDILARMSGARSRVLPAELHGYELSLSTEPRKATAVTGAASANELSIAKARWHQRRLVVDIDYQLKDASGATLSFGIQRAGDAGAVVFDRKSHLASGVFSGSFTLDPSSFTALSLDGQHTSTLSVFLMSATGEFLAHAEALIPPLSQSVPVRATLQDATLEDSVRQLARGSQVNIVLDDPQHRAATSQVHLVTSELPLVDVLAIIERLTGTIVHGSDRTLIVTVPESAPPAAAPENPPASTKKPKISRGMIDL